MSSAAGNHGSSAGSDKEGGECYPHVHPSPQLLLAESVSVEDLGMGTKMPLHRICPSLGPLCTQLDCQGKLLPCDAGTQSTGQASRSHEIRQKALLPERNTWPKWGRRSSHICSWKQVTREWSRADHSQGSCPCALQVDVITLHVYSSSSAHPVAGSPVQAMACMPAPVLPAVPSPVLLSCTELLHSQPVPSAELGPHQGTRSHYL